MRSVTAVIAAILSVVTGGPLRCPCQVAALGRGAEHVAEFHAANEADDCPCHSHRKPCLPQSTEHKHAPCEPCRHGAAIDVLAPVVTGERLSGEREAVDRMPLVPGDCSQGSPGCGLDGMPLDNIPVSSSASDQLRYCHSFLC